MKKKTCIKIKYNVFLVNRTLIRKVITFGY